MDKPSFVYVICIPTTPEKLWNALMDAEMTKQYWGLAKNVSDWKVGSTWQHQDYDEPSMVKVVGKVIESVPLRRLVNLGHAPHRFFDAAQVGRASRHEGERDEGRGRPVAGAADLHRLVTRSCLHDRFSSGVFWCLG
jgi:Activator of Hsp90 ATPase homolog 1-like protein